MDAETLVAELIKVVAQKLADEAMKRIVRAQGIHSELKELGKTLSRIQDLLVHASEIEVTDKSVKQWLTTLQHLAYDINDALDDLATDAMHRELTPESGAIISKVRQLIPTCCKNLSLSHRLSPKLDSFNKELENLEKQNPGLIVKGEKPNTSSRKNETCLPDASRIVGREGEVEKLLNKLLKEEESNENFNILPIVGMGGVGKTTLARHLYNDTSVKDHFEVKAWVCISDDFDILKISDAILQSVTEKDNKNTNLNTLQMALMEQSKDKRFLLVLDDVWHENYDDWENLVRPFHSCAIGSKIVMTTRKDQLLKKLGFHHLDRLDRLSNEDALSLLARHALGVDNFNSHTILKPLGEGIVNKCACLPLALKAIGRLLRERGTSTDGGYWNYVLNSAIWDIEDGKNIIPALMLSYYELPANLKQLFAYCSLFPKDFLFDKEELGLLWMAEGFLNPSNPTTTPESLSHEYFETLLSRSFFQHAPNNELLFVMHDLMVDLATFVAGEFFLRCDNQMKIEEQEAFPKRRYMSLVPEKYIAYDKLEKFNTTRSLRAMLTPNVSVDQRPDYVFISNKILDDLLPKLALLRVLSLSWFTITDVPESIGNMKHLRYLNLSRTSIEDLPESVSNLYNLQTLILSGCIVLTKLPDSFLKLRNLRHFDIQDTPRLEKLPLGIGELKNLQTLTRIIISADGGFSITELKGLKNLHGKVSIVGLHKVQSAKHARAADFSLKKISELRMEWVDVFDGSRRGTLEKEVLDELKPNSDRLIELSIVSYGGTKFSNWLGDPSFHRLVNVSLRGCRKCTYLPSLGQLPSLKELFIQGMDDVKAIGLELCGPGTLVAFPSLEKLKFEDMLGWEEWSSNRKVVFPCLQELHMYNCPNLIDVSVEALLSLRLPASINLTYHYIPVPRHVFPTYHKTHFFPHQ